MNGNVMEVFSTYQGEGRYVGAPQVFVRLGGCHLRCRYCDTPESWERSPTCRVDGRSVPNPVDSGDVATWVRRLMPRACHSVSFTGGEPILQAPFIRAVVEAMPGHPPIYLDTSGSLPGKLEEVIDVVDIVALDCKLPSTPGAAVPWDDFAACLAIARRRDVFVKIVLTRDANADEIAKAAAIIGRDVEVYLQPATPFVGAEPAPAERVARYRDVFVKGGLTTFVVPQIHPLVGWR